MSFGIDFVEVSSGSVYTTIDTYNSALLNNGATQLLGSIYQAPLVPANQSVAGGGSNQVFKYVRYNPTVSQALLTGPTLMYWKDETFTTVTGLYSEAFAGINNIAGWLLYNTTALSTATAAQINGNFCYIQVGGFLGGAYVTAAAAAGAAIFGAASTFGATGTTAASSAPTNVVAGWALKAAASNLTDLWVPPLY